MSDDASGFLHYFGTTLETLEPFTLTLPIGNGLIGAPATPPPGDFDGDFRIDNADLNLLMGSWGSFTAPAAWRGGFVAPIDNGELNDLLGGWNSTNDVAVPEPHAVMLAAVMLMTLSQFLRQPR